MSFVVCHQILFGLLNLGRWGGRSTYDVWGEKKCIMDFGGQTEEKNHFEEKDVDGILKFKYILKK